MADSIDIDDPARRPGYVTSPPEIKTLPTGIPYIIGNEAAERFSYYGMRAILVVFMTKHILNHAGELETMSEAQASSYAHWFMAGAYFFPLLGSILSDVFWGKYRTIIILSLVYCAGHLALALDSTRTGLLFGLTLIAIGAGGIKPCVSAHVGDQFGRLNQHFMSQVFNWFYLAINIGAFLSMMLTPWLLTEFGPHVAFGVPGILMFLATWVFWLGRHKFVHIPPGGTGFLREALSKEGLKAITSLSLLYVFVAVFWSLFDQSATAWVLQADRMDRQWLGVEWKASQMQAVNALYILILIPLFNVVIYPAAGRFVKVTPFRKISVGLFLMAGTFWLTAQIERWLQAGETVHVLWQILAYLPLTASEVLVSPTCLEFSYSQAPRKMKSFIMSLYLLTVTAGNLLAGQVNSWIDDGTLELSGVAYFKFFTWLMFGAAVLFCFVPYIYRGREYVQE
ncbi:MAG: POT family MFS transporter [Planctomycetota bacterium]|nr:POT family MFS transporter [Planctomycetota bacterium]MDA1212360.1 POT family MFS transporter [Planctomycetota bacterium]